MRRFFIFIGLATWTTAGFAAPISGIGRPIDGDSLMVEGAEVRLYGIDAPELSQMCTRERVPWPCGRASLEQLSKLISDQPIICEPVGRDRHGRTLARCRVGDRDINRALVASGFALAYRRYSMDYVSAEESAKLSKRGIWAGSFDLPSEVRHAEEDYVIQNSPGERRSSIERPVVSSIRRKPQPSGNCRIKGNHSRRGEKIYHLPGMPYYAQTVAEEIFCTEGQARAAGYRRSRADRHR